MPDDVASLTLTRLAVGFGRESCPIRPCAVLDRRVAEFTPRMQTAVPEHSMRFPRFPYGNSARLEDAAYEVVEALCSVSYSLAGIVVKGTKGSKFVRKRPFSQILKHESLHIAPFSGSISLNPAQSSVFLILPKTVSAFLVVIAAISSKVTPFRCAASSATSRTYAVSLRFPRYG